MYFFFQTKCTCDRVTEIIAVCDTLDACGKDLLSRRSVVLECELCDRTEPHRAGHASDQNTAMMRGRSSHSFAVPLSRRLSLSKNSLSLSLGRARFAVNHRPGQRPAVHHQAGPPGHRGPRGRLPSPTTWLLLIALIDSPYEHNRNQNKINPGIELEKKIH